MFAKVCLIITVIVEHYISVACDQEDFLLSSKKIEAAKFSSNRNICLLWRHLSKILRGNVVELVYKPNCY